MKAASEIRNGVGVLIAVQVVVALGAVGLLVRMNPAIESLIADDAAGITDVNAMYAAMATDQCGIDDSVGEARFGAAIEAYRERGITPQEDAAFGTVDKSWRNGLGGDCDARLATLDGLDGLLAAHGERIRAEHARVRTLGSAGAWAAVILGMFGFLAATGLGRRFSERLAEPMVEIERVLHAATHGDPYRRCARLPATEEYRVIAARVNQLLDRQLAAAESEDPVLKNTDRELLLHLLDRQPEPTLAVDTSGAIIAASDAALDLLAGAGIQNLADALSVGSDGEEDGISLIQRVEPFGKQAGFLISLRPLRPTGDPASMLEEPPKPPEAPPTRKFTDSLADVGAADDATNEVVPPSPRVDKPDWERD